MRQTSKVFFVLLLCAACAPAYALVNINTASHEELVTLNGIGDTYAARIIVYRNQNGSFKTIEDIEEVKGIGPATFANIKDEITVDGPTTVAQPAPPVPKPAPKTLQKPAPVSVPQPAVQNTVPQIIPQAQAAAVSDALSPIPPAQAEPYPLEAALIGLAGIAGLAAAGLWYARGPEKPQPKPGETPLDPDEFIIE